MTTFWDERYQQPEYVYGTSPNVFFVESLNHLRPSGNILLPAEGEGRNAVGAAQYGLEVTAFDQSVEGKKKAMQLADRHDVEINYIVGELSALDFDQDSFDVMALIYVHFPLDQKFKYYQRLAKLLKPGGHLILEVFSKNHIRFQKENPTAGGPKDIDMLLTVVEIQQLFPDFKSIVLKEEVIQLDEGLYHIGKASVIRFIGKKIVNNK